MSTQSNLPINMGDVVDASNWPDWMLGVEGTVDDKDPTADRPVLLSGRLVYVRLVRNGEATDPLLPGMAVKRKGPGNSLADVIICGAGEVADCFISPYIPAAGCPVDRACLAVFEGPTSVIKGDGNITYDNVITLVTAAAGRVNPDTDGDYANEDAEVGYPLEVSTAAAGTLVRALIKRR